MKNVIFWASALGFCIPSHSPFNLNPNFFFFLLPPHFFFPTLLCFPWSKLSFIDTARQVWLAPSNAYSQAWHLENINVCMWTLNGGRFHSLVSYPHDFLKWNSSYFFLTHPITGLILYQQKIPDKFWRILSNYRDMAYSTIITSEDSLGAKNLTMAALKWLCLPHHEYVPQPHAHLTHCTLENLGIQFPW